MKLRPSALPILQACHVFEQGAPSEYTGPGTKRHEVLARLLKEAGGGDDSQSLATSAATAEKRQGAAAVQDAGANPGAPSAEGLLTSAPTGMEDK